MMTEPLMLVVAVVAGLVLGGLFFGGLWWTVRRGVSSSRPALWFVCSLVVRMTIAVLGFYLVSGGQWQRLVACLLGFVIARYVVVRLARAPVERSNPPAREAPHAP